MLKSNSEPTADGETLQQALTRVLAPRPVDPNSIEQELLTRLVEQLHAAPRDELAQIAALAVLRLTEAKSVLANWSLQTRGLVGDLAGQLADRRAEVDALSTMLTAHAKAASAHGKRLAEDRHSKPGGARDLRDQIRTIWASGKYDSRDLCAEQEWAGLGFGSISTARKALRNTPDPT